MKTNYEEPQVEAIEVKLEQGLAQSGGTTGGGQVPDLGKDDDLNW